MIERSLIMYPHEVRATLDNRQTQFRRVMKVQPGIRSHGPYHAISNNHYGVSFVTKPNINGRGGGERVYFNSPYGVPGDRLWVRETWAYGDNVRPRIEDKVIYKTDERWAATWRPSIHMPRWASRLTLEVVNVRVERLQEITKWDAIAEGMIIKPLTHVEPRFQFERLWDSTNGKKHPWSSNPWVWAVEFKRV